MFSERSSFSNATMCGASKAACTSACPCSFNSCISLLCTVLLAVLVIFLGAVLNRIEISAGILLPIVIIGFGHIFTIKKLEFKSR